MTRQRQPIHLPNGEGMIQVGITVKDRVHQYAATRGWTLGRALDDLVSRGLEIGITCNVSRCPKTNVVRFVITVAGLDRPLFVNLCEDHSDMLAARGTPAP